MSVQLVKGVNLHVIPTEKYKTVRLLVRFNTRLNHETIKKNAVVQFDGNQQLELPESSQVK